MRKLTVFLALSAMVLLTGFTDRPRDPWVFRCVLDKRPRMVVIALHEHLWVAYDATTCSLYKAWDGDVKFQGAVYDDVHGPQPVSRGEAYFIDNFKGLLSVTQSQRELKLAWRGYRYEDEGVVLMYDVKLDDGTVVHISERPEVEIKEDGSVRFVRTYESSDYPDDVTILIHHNSEGQPPPSKLISGGQAGINTFLIKVTEDSSR